VPPGPRSFFSYTAPAAFRYRPSCPQILATGLGVPVVRDPRYDGGFIVSKMKEAFSSTLHGNNFGI